MQDQSGFRSLFALSVFDSEESTITALDVDTLTVTDTIDLTDAEIKGLETSDVAETTNLYYTTSRFDSRLSTKTTDDIAEGVTNLYFTSLRVTDTPDVKSNTAHRARTDNPHAVTPAQIGITSLGSTAIITSAERTAINNNTTNIGTLVGDITFLSTRIDATEVDIKTNYDQILTNIGDISTNKTDIFTNAGDIKTNTTAIATNTTDITTNAGGIATNTTAIATSAADIKTNATAIATNVTDIKTNTAAIATNVTDIKTNATAIATNVTDIATNVTDIATNATAIATNVTDIATNVTAIAAIPTYDQSLNTTDSPEFKTLTATSLISTGTLQAPLIISSLSLAADTITETTPAAGVTVDGVLIKDGLIDGVDVSAIVSYPATDSKKVGYITVTAPIDLDALPTYDQDLNTTDAVSFATVNGFDLSTIEGKSSAEDVLLGGLAGASLTSGTYNTATGYFALRYAAVGNYNTMYGNRAGGMVGSHNTCIGYFAGRWPNSVSSGNTFIGSDSASPDNGTASNCVALGYASRVGSSLNNQIAIGYQATADASNQCTIGNGSINVIRTGGNGICDLGGSSRQFKDLYLSGTVVGANLFPTLSYTPTAQDSLGRGFTVNVSNGFYFRIGKKVFVQVNFAWSGKGSASGRIRFSLPVASLAPVPVTLTVGYHYGITYNSMLMAVGGGGNGYFELFSATSGGSTSFLTNADYNTAGQIQVQGFYST